MGKKKIKSTLNDIARILLQSFGANNKNLSTANELPNKASLLVNKNKSF